MIFCATLVALTMFVTIWQRGDAGRPQHAGPMQPLGTSLDTVMPPGQGQNQPLTASKGSDDTKSAIPTGDTTGVVSQVRGRQVRSESDLLKDPAYRSARVRQVRAGLVQQYRELATELALLPNEVNEIFDILAEQQIEERAAPFPADPYASSETLEAVRREHEVIRNRANEKLVALIGHDKFLKFEEFRNELPGRRWVNQLSNRIVATGLQPLNSEQSRHLITALAAEERRRADESASFQRIAPTLDHDTFLKVQKENLERAVEGNRKIAELASIHLNSYQLEELRKMLDEPLQLQRLRESQRQ